MLWQVALQVLGGFSRKVFTWNLSPQDSQQGRQKSNQSIFACPFTPFLWAPPQLLESWGDGSQKTEALEWTMTHWDISHAWSGHQPLLTGQNITSEMNSVVAACKRESSLCSSGKRKNPSFSVLQPCQCQVKERWDATAPMYTQKLWNSMFSDFSKSHSKMLWMSQGSSAQVYKHNTVCPVCSQTGFLRKVTKLARDKKKDILAAGRRGIGRQTIYSHASMTRWFLVGIKKAICSETASPTPFYSQETAS